MNNNYGYHERYQFRRRRPYAQWQTCGAGDVCQMVEAEMNRPITDYVSGAAIGAINLGLTICTSEYEFRLRPSQIDVGLAAVPLAPHLAAS